MLPEKGSIRGVARATGHSKNTIFRWLEIAGLYLKEGTTYFLINLNLKSNLKRVEVDEIWSYIKKQKNVTEEDSEEYDDVYSLTAIKSDTRLLLFHHEGKSSTEDAIELFNGVENMRDASSPIPVFTSDDWGAFEEGLINVYGKIGCYNTKVLKEDHYRNWFHLMI